MFEITSYSDLEHIDVIEEDEKYSTIILFNKDKFLDIQKEKIDLKEGANIKRESRLKRTLNKLQGRENIIYMGRTSIENTIDIEDIDQRTTLQLVSTHDIMKIKNQIKNKEYRKKIGYISI